MSPARRWLLSPMQGCPGVNDPGQPPRRGGARRRRSGHGAPGRERGGDRARRERPRRRAIPLPRLSAAARGGAACPVGGGSVVELRRSRVRVATTVGACARRARPREPRAAGRGLPRADEALRGGRQGYCGRARRPVSRAGQGRGDGRDRRRARPTSRRTEVPPSTRCASSSTPVHRVGWPSDVVARLAGASRNELYRSSLAPPD